MRDPVPFQHPWPEKLLGEIAKVTVGGTPSTAIARYWDGDVPWMASGDIHLGRIYDVSGRITDVGLKASNATLVKPDAVAIALAGQGKTRGTVALTKTILCTNQSVALISPDERELFPEYLYQSLIPRYEELRNRSAGGGRAGLTKAILEQVPVQLPPLAEQRGIAELLSVLDEQIELTEALIAKLELTRSGLYAILRDTHTPTIHIGDHFNLTSGMTPLRSTAHFYGAEGVPWVKTLDLNEGRLFETDEKVTARALAACSLRVLPAGTVLLAMYGGWIQIGRTALLEISACTNQAITALCPKFPGDWNPYFVMKALQAWRHKWRDFAVSTRKDPNITKSDISQFMLPMPGIAEQTHWAESLESADELIDAHKAEATKLRLQKQGLMRDILTGNVRVH